MSDLTDAMAVMNTKDNGIFGSSGATWLIILILFFLGGMGGFGFGGNNAAANYATRSDVQDLITSSSLQNNMTDGIAALNQNISNGVAGINQNIFNGVAGLNQTMNAIASNEALAMNTGFNTVNSNLQTLQSNMASCCCDIKTTLGNKISEVENLINNNTISALQSKIADKDRDLQSANLTAAILSQTNSLESYIRTAINGGCSCGA